MKSRKLQRSWPGPFDAVCAFVNNHADRDTIQSLKGLPIRIISLRSAGINQVEMKPSYIR
ncbi:MAG TPA: hypothetical protein VE954_15725 [Oligoflexus sp.]|uniref:hypothetical protein n=1 Tax=Oligoflexus sp. TaxID=1971216 RepID=UPI002D38E45F|nr:hypothetical protein [Oligoflexus sp.]HYX34551.1 hypothetical protein [Oligoflexus sp.]